MRKKMEWQWEILDECTQRTQVIGGWLVMRVGAVDCEKGKKVQFRESLVFVPDRDHEWHIVPPMVPVEQQAPSVLAKDFASK